MRGGALVGFHDSGDKRMPDDIAADKGAKRDVLNVVRTRWTLFRPESPRGRSSWVMSPVITILELKPRRVRNILHLLGGRVLSFVQDNEAVVEGAAAHERQRRDLYHAAFDELARPLHVGHVEKGVVERPDVGF